MYICFVNAYLDISIFQLEVFFDTLGFFFSLYIFGISYMTHTSMCKQKVSRRTVQFNHVVVNMNV